MFQILAISGSLRAESSNTVVLRAAASLAPDGVQVTLYDGLSELPHFNPDLDTETPPESVMEFRARLREADAVVVCSPEYAHGVPGVLKNALDWVVGSGEFMHKPVALWNLRSASTHAQAQLAETLSVMMADINEAASISTPLTSNRLDVESIRDNAELANILGIALCELAGTTA